MRPGEVDSPDTAGEAPPAQVPLADYQIGSNGTVFSPQGGLRITARDLARIAILKMNRGEVAGVRLLTPEGGGPAQGHGALSCAPFQSRTCGIGQATARKLQAFGVTTVVRLAAFDLKHVRQLGTIVLERRIAGLRGVLGIPLELAEIVEANSTHATRADEKLRTQGLVAGQLTAFLQTNPHKPGPRHDGTRSMRLSPMTADLSARPHSPGLMAVLDAVNGVCRAATRCGSVRWAMTTLGRRRPRRSRRSTRRGTPRCRPDTAP